MPVLHTPRLRLRPAVPSDAVLLAELREGHPEPHIRVPASADEERAAIERHRKEHYEARGYGMFIVELRETERVIGTAGLHEAAPLGEEEPELFVWIARPCRGRGHWLEAINAVLEWARTGLGLESVLALVHPDNGQSQGLLAAYGHQPIGRVDFRGTADVTVYRVPTRPLVRRASSSPRSPDRRRGS